jgi:hypothetical protein
MVGFELQLDWKLTILIFFINVFIIFEEKKVFAACWQSLLTLSKAILMVLGASVFMVRAKRETE